MTHNYTYWIQTADATMAAEGCCSSAGEAIRVYHSYNWELAFDFRTELSKSSEPSSVSPGLGVVLNQGEAILHLCPRGGGVVDMYWTRITMTKKILGFIPWTERKSLTLSAVDESLAMESIRKFFKGNTAWLERNFTRGS